MADRLQRDERNIPTFALEATMSRRNHLTLLSAGIAIVTAACHPSTPTTSVSALSYQLRSSGQRSISSAATASVCAPSAQPASREATGPAEISPNDPLRLFDIP